MKIINWVKSFFKTQERLVVKSKTDKLVEIIAKISQHGIPADHKEKINPLERIKIAVMMIESTGVDSTNPLHIQALYEETMKISTNEMANHAEEGIEEAQEENMPSANAFMIKNASKMTH